MEDVKREVLEKVRGAKPWGVDVVDVRITRVDYVEAITESVYRRMEAERKRVANELRSTGAAEGEKIRADADRQREITIANAYRDAQKIKGEGDAEAARVYAEAFGRDAQFAQFYRSLEAYKASFANKSDVMVLDPASSEFFKVFRNYRGPFSVCIPCDLAPHVRPVAANDRWANPFFCRGQHFKWLIADLVARVLNYRAQAR
jgi:membrane protease subunit HflC